MGDIANTIFNKVLVKMLSKYLAYYMNNFSKESFKLQVIKGTFALEDIEINCQFLKDTVVLPNLEITECLCDKIFLTVPWGHITTESIVFDLDKITMTLTEIPIGAKGDSKPKKVKPSSYGWMQRTVDGIKMNIKEIDMTAKLNGYRGNPFVGHILCKGISIYSTDANWKPVDLKEAFVADKQKSEIVFFKVLDCENLTVSFADAQNEPLEFCTMMRDAAVQIRCKVAKDAKDGHVICGEFHLVMQDCELSYSDTQWKGFLELAKGLVGCFTRTDQEYVHYRDVGKTGEELEKGGRAKIPPEKSSSWWERRKQAKEQERVESEKAKRLYEMELRAKERQELESIGADTTHLEVMEETTFNIQIDKGVLNMLDEENRLSNEPGKHAFARLFFEDMKIVIGLPPAMDVPDSNKWTANTRNRLLLDAYLQLGNFALQIQEPLHGAGDDAAGSSSGQKRLVMLTDGRSESLKRRVKKQRRKKEKGKKKGNGKRRTQKKQKPFCHVGWTVRSNTPEETNMADWLKSLECKMAISVYQSHLILLHRWWARIIRYLETSSVGSDEVQAMALMKVVATLDVTDNVIMLPLAGCDKLEVLTQEEIEALPHVTLYCTKLKGGKAVIESAVAKRLAATRIPARFVPDIIQGNGKGKGKEVDARPSTSKKVSKHILHVEGMGAGEDGWLTQKLMRKPQRFQFLLQNMILNIGKDQILSPVDYNLELTLHRYLSTEQLLLEMTSHVEAVQLHINRAQYLLFAHFLNYLSTVVWPELEMVVLRKYGPSHIQRSLNEMSYTELAKKIGYMPMSVNTHTAIDYLLLHINGNELPQDLVNSIFKLDTKERDLSIVEMHVEDLATHSTNTTIVKSDVYQKDASVRRITLFAPPGRPQQETDNKGKEQGKPTSGDRNGPTLKVETLTGDVLSNHFSDMQELLVERNVDTLSRLLAPDEKGLSAKGLPPQLHVAAVDLLVDNSRASQVPPEVATFLKDFATLNNSC